jgi:hypothetical protein
MARLQKHPILYLYHNFKVRECLRVELLTAYRKGFSSGFRLGGGSLNH